MDITTLLVVLGLIGTAWSASVSVCPDGCRLAESNKTHQHFKYLMENHTTSVAPWKLESETVDGREPRTIRFASCKTCSITDMDPEEIKIMIYVYKMSITGSPPHWCKCPYEVAVGCTCVPN